MNDEIENTFPKIRYWWVNQGSTFLKAVEQGFIWAPKKSKTNTSLFHWENVSRVRKTDIIFHYSEGFIKAVSRASVNSYDSLNELDGNAWTKEGWRVDTKIHLLSKPVSINKVGSLLARLNIDKGPVNHFGGVNQGYLYELPLQAVNILFNEIGPIPFLEHIQRSQETQVVSQLVFPETPTDLLKAFHDACINIDLHVVDRTVTRFLSSLSSKRFLVLTGLAGSGKTKLAQAFSQWICPALGKGEENPYYALVPVGADWMGNENILGYPNGLRPGEYIAKPALELILHAKDNPDTPHFLILDEMNLSHVERYFADILSAIESGAPIPLHRETAMKAGELEVPPSVVLPANLFIIGTVNVDETTYMFSPKVLDRANVIEFRMAESDLTAFLSNVKAPNLDALNGLGEGYGAAFVAAAKNKDITVPDEALDPFTTELSRLFGLLQKHNAEFGYRVAYEAARFMHFYKELSGAPEGWFNEAMDAVIVQKLLPKLHGSRSKLEGLLEALAWLCADGSTHGDTDPEQVRKAVTDPRYPLSFEKVMRMWEKLVRDQFVSFAEA